MQGLEPFTTEWDETYVHDHLSDQITVLMERVEGDHREPYTWVREYGKGWVFYTAFGHDERTFRKPAFLRLCKTGILWAVAEVVAGRLTDIVLVVPTIEPATVTKNERR